MNRVSFLNDVWIPNNNSISSMIEGSFTTNDQTTKVDNVYNNSDWNTLSITVPDNIMNIITSTFIPNNTSKDNKIIWGLTRNDIFSIK